MPTRDPIIKINGITIAYEPNTFKHQKGSSERKFFPDTLNAIHITEDKSTAVGMISFDLRSESSNEVLFNGWVQNGINNIITFTRDGLSTNVSGCAVENPNIEIESGSDSTFNVSFKGNPVVE